LYLIAILLFPLELVHCLAADALGIVADFLSWGFHGE
jgi:hypothetical protein